MSFMAGLVSGGLATVETQHDSDADEVADSNGDDDAPRNTTSDSGDNTSGTNIFEVIKVCTMRKRVCTLQILSPLTVLVVDLSVFLLRVTLTPTKQHDDNAHRSIADSGGNTCGKQYFAASKVFTICNVSVLIKLQRMTSVTTY